MHAVRVLDVLDAHDVGKIAHFSGPVGNSNGDMREAWDHVIAHCAVRLGQPHCSLRTKTKDTCNQKQWQTCRACVVVNELENLVLA